MTDDDGVRITDVRDYTKTIKRNKPRMDMGGHGHGIETIREDDYKGHHIVIRTRYETQMDGQPSTAHMALTNAARRYYHPRPNPRFPSAIVRRCQLIAPLPDEFPPDRTRNTPGR